MESYFLHITETNKECIKNQRDIDIVYYCELHEWENKDAFRGLGLKYVIDSCIHYQIQKRSVSIESGEILLTCKKPEVKACFESRDLSKHICIDISYQTVRTVFEGIYGRESPAFDRFLDRYFQKPDFFESTYTIKSAPEIHSKLNLLFKDITTGNATMILGKEWFYDLTEKIICREYSHSVALTRIPSVKMDTKKETLSRLIKAKQFMDEHFQCITAISEVSGFCFLSEFHFFRSFRQVFGITPYQYLLQKRLEYSKKLITDGETISRVYPKCNFHDLPTFSKAFKRLYGVAPSYMTHH